MSRRYWDWLGGCLGFNRPVKVRKLPSPPNVTSYEIVEEEANPMCAGSTFKLYKKGTMTKTERLAEWVRVYGAERVMSIIYDSSLGQLQDSWSATIEEWAESIEDELNIDKETVAKKIEQWCEDCSHRETCEFVERLRTGGLSDKNILVVLENVVDVCHDCWNNYDTCYCCGDDDERNGYP